MLSVLTFAASYPVSLRSFRVDVLGLFLLAFAPINLRLAFRPAGAGARASGESTLLWFRPVGLASAVPILFRAAHALGA